MSIFSTLHFNWLPQRSMYADAQVWAQRQRVVRQQTDDLAAVSDIVASVAVDKSQGMMDLAARAALGRTQAAARAKVQSVLNPAADTSSSSKKASSSAALILPDGTTVKADPTQYLPGGSKLNLAAGTLTLSNGTVIDTTTGLKKINLTV
jgi:hypothetical protein